jgi:transposase-like protein
MKRYSKEIREEVLKKIRSGEKLALVAKAHGMHEVTVRSWLERSTEYSGNGSVGGAPLLEISRLKRENEALLRLVGQLTYESDTQKKKSSLFKQ